MSDSPAGLRRQIASATSLQSVTRTMKAMAAANIGQYDKAVQSLDQYYRAVQLALLASLRGTPAPLADGAAPAPAGVIVFGSDQGLVGRFNEAMQEFVTAALAALPGDKIVWAVGERLAALLGDAPAGAPAGALTMRGAYPLPQSVDAVAPLVGRLLRDVDKARARGEIGAVLVFHHQGAGGAAYAPVMQRLLPPDRAWRDALAGLGWPGPGAAAGPEVLGAGPATTLAFVREYLFTALFRACAASLASENASRLAAMQRAERNIGELLQTLRADFHRLRQEGIDEELFDLVAGFEALGGG